ncbi:MAG: glycosyltransferase family 2 protein [Acidobacteriaceae bacterium]|nr:glycosyltransferase family 2 protein [Acidobacteriaceae bacterium]
MSTVSAIIPTWNRADLLKQILPNLRSQTRVPEQIVVVDNGSSDDSLEVARSLNADVVQFSENRGFAAAVNEGIKRAWGDWILIVNNDVVLEPEWLEVLVRCAEQHGAAFATGKLLQSSQVPRIDGTWDMISRAAHAWRCGYGRPDGTTWSTIRKIWFAPMTAALFRRSLFDAVGVLDERFEAYYEDIDFGLRCTLAGFEGVYEPAAVAVHLGKSTLGKKGSRVIFLTARNQILLLAKHYSPRTLRRFAWPILVGQVLAVIGAATHGQLLAAARGKWAGLRLWSKFRTGVARSSEMDEKLESALSRSEHDILNLQHQIGFDPYWRAYFSLVRPA